MSEHAIRQDFAQPGRERQSRLEPSRPRRAPSAGALARRRVLLRLARLALPLGAAALLALIMFWPDMDGGPARLSFQRGPALVPEALTVVEPRYRGLDEMNRPYTLTADAGRVAREGGAVGEVVVLDRPRADMLLSDGSWVYLESVSGRYARPDGLLDLAGDVTVYHDRGMMVRTEAAAVQVEAGRAQGDRATHAQGPFGTIESEGFEIIERGAVVVFTGRARALLVAREP